VVAIQRYCTVSSSQIIDTRGKEGIRDAREEDVQQYQSVGKASGNRASELLRKRKSSSKGTRRRINIKKAKAQLSQLLQLSELSILL
jgi:hypothetical protein